MKFLSVALVLCLSLSFDNCTAKLRRDVSTRCCFFLSAHGVVSGAVNEDATGENQVGGISPLGEYCISNGVLTDFGGSPCRMDTSTGQFLCENNTASTSRFTIADNGNLLHEGCPNYFACLSSSSQESDTYNIFSDQIGDSTGCENVTISTGGFSCAVEGRPSSTLSTSSSTKEAVVRSTSTSATSDPSIVTTRLASPTSTSTPSCPTDISSGKYLSPSLIVPISSFSPSTSFGNSSSATIARQNSTVYTFDIPFTALYTGTCSLIFLLPTSNRAAHPFTFSGIEQEVEERGGLDFILLMHNATSPITSSTTYNSAPAVVADYGTIRMLPGNNYTVATGECRSGQVVGYEIRSTNLAYLDYVQSVQGSPIGLFVVPCS